MDKIEKLDTAINVLLRVLLIEERRVSSKIATVRFNLIDLATLSFLDRNPGVLAKDVAAYLQVSTTTMQSVVDRLVKRRFLKRDKSVLKGRGVAISLTPEGIAFRNIIHEQNLRNCEIMLSAIDPLDQERFVDSMGKIATKFS